MTLNNCIECNKPLNYITHQESNYKVARCCKIFYKHDTCMFFHNTNQIHIHYSKSMNKIYISQNNKNVHEIEGLENLSKKEICSIIESLIFK